MSWIDIYFHCNSDHIFIFHCYNNKYYTLMLHEKWWKKWLKCCKLYSLICDPDEKMWIFGFFPGVCSTELRNLVSSLEYLVSNGRQVLLEGVRLGGSTTFMMLNLMKPMIHTKRMRTWKMLEAFNFQMPWRTWMLVNWGLGKWMMMKIIKCKCSLTQMCKMIQIKLEQVASTSSQPNDQASASNQVPIL